MQTFLPLADFALSAKVLDSKRLGKQRLEGSQILRSLTGLTTGGWLKHPAVEMWRGYEHALCRYVIIMCREWRARGYEDNLLLPVKQIQVHLELHKANTELPPWIGDERIHASHRSNLLRKLPGHYGQLGWQEPNDLPYFWPVTKQEDVDG